MTQYTIGIDLGTAPQGAPMKPRVPAPIALHNAVLYHWARVVIDPETTQVGGPYCAYCLEYTQWGPNSIRNECEGCPIDNRTHNSCHQTPYYKAMQAQRRLQLTRSGQLKMFYYTNPPILVTLPQLLENAQQAATDEYLFLLDIVARELGWAWYFSD